MVFKLQHYYVNHTSFSNFTRTHENAFTMLNEIIATPFFFLENKNEKFEQSKSLVLTLPPPKPQKKKCIEQIFD